MPTFEDWYRLARREVDPVTLAQDAYNFALEQAARHCEEKYDQHSQQSKKRQTAEELANDLRSFLAS
jgi:hypothetical protein